MHEIGTSVGINIVVAKEMLVESFSLARDAFQNRKKQAAETAAKSSGASTTSSRSSEEILTSYPGWPLSFLKIMHFSPVSVSAFLGHYSSLYFVLGPYALVKYC